MAQLIYSSGTYLFNCSIHYNDSSLRGRLNICDCVNDYTRLRYYRERPGSDLTVITCGQSVPDLLGRQCVIYCEETTGCKGSLSEVFRR
uniref:Uncharacterized protein n=1 Tax=Trichuris muris TaxID=70415 RepID=A0A5S6QZ38_TRIMR